MQVIVQDPKTRQAIIIEVGNVLAEREIALIKQAIDLIETTSRSFK